MTDEPRHQTQQHPSREQQKGTVMKNFLLTSLAVLTAATLALTATANAAPAGPSSVDATISQLHSQGFEVIVNRVSHAASEQCTISAVRPGQTFTRFDSGVPGAKSDAATTVISKTVYVDLSC
jgi:hypothetical protein